MSLALYLRCSPAEVDELGDRDLATLLELLK